MNNSEDYMAERARLRWGPAQHAAQEAEDRRAEALAASAGKDEPTGRNLNERKHDVAKAKKKSDRPILRKRAVPKTMAVLVGRITLHATRTNPALVLIDVYCPYCRDEHRHSWGTDKECTRTDYVTHRAAHCHNRESPLRELGYYIALDPTRKDEHAKVFAAAAKA